MRRILPLEYSVPVPQTEWRSDLQPEWRRLCQLFHLSEGEMVEKLFVQALFNLLLDYRHSSNNFKDQYGYLQLPLPFGEFKADV